MSNQVVSTTLLARGVAAYQARMTQAATANARFGASAAVPSARAKTMQGRMSGLAQSAGLINPALMGSAGAVVAIKAVAGAGLEWESAFAGVTKTVEGTTGQMDAISQGLRDMSKEIPTSAEDLAAIAESAGQLGIETDNVLEFTRVIADLGETTNLVGQEGATSLARFANITQMSQGDFDRLGSTIVDLGNNFAATEAEIVDMALRLAGAGSQIGLTEDQILGVSTALVDVGIGAEAGGTAFSKVMIDIANAAQSGGDELAAFADVAGMSSDAFATMVANSPGDALVALVEGLGAASDRGENLFEVIEGIGVTEVRMRDALLRSAGAGDTLSEALDGASGAWQENTALQDEAAQRYETTAAKMEILTNNVKDAARELGTGMLPQINFLVEGLTALFDSTDKAGNRLSTFSEDASGAERTVGVLRDISGKNAFDWISDSVERLLSDDGLTQVERQLAETDDTTGRLTAATERGTITQGEFRTGLDDSKGAAGGLEGQLDETKTATEKAAEAQQGYIDLLNRATDPVFNLMSAIQDVDAAQEAYNDAVKEYGTDSEQAKDASVNLMSQLGNLEQAAINGDLSFGDFSAKLRSWVSQGKITADQASDIRGRVEDARQASEDYSGEYRAYLEATDNASSIIDRIRGKLAALPRSVTTRHIIAQTGGNRGGITMHEGGWAGNGPIHQGALKADEIPTVLQKGEFVLSRSMLSQMANNPKAMPAGGSTVTVNVAGNLDGVTLAKVRNEISGALGRSRQSARAS